MKKNRDRLKFLFAATILLALISCDRVDLEGLTASDKEVLPELHLSQNELSYEAGDYNTEVSKQLIFLSCNTKWEIVNVPEWLDVKPLLGKGNDTISIKPTQWDKLKHREWTLRIKADRLRDSIIIKQTPFRPIIKPEKTSIEFKEPNDSVSFFTLTCNSQWIIDYNRDWFEINPSEGLGTTEIQVKRIVPGLWEGNEERIMCKLANYEESKFVKSVMIKQDPLYKLDIQTTSQTPMEYHFSKEENVAVFYIWSNVQWKMSPGGQYKSHWIKIDVDGREIRDFENDITGVNNATIKLTVGSVNNFDDTVESNLSITCDNDSLCYTGISTIIIKQGSKE